MNETAKKYVHYIVLSILVLAVIYNLYLGTNDYTIISSLLLLSATIMIGNKKMIQYECGAILIYVTAFNLLLGGNHYPFVACICIFGLVIAHYLKD